MNRDERLVSLIVLRVGVIMEDYLEIFKEKHKSVSPSPTFDKLKSIRGRINHLSTYIYPKIIPNSLKYIESRSKHSYQPRSFIRPAKEKDHVIKHLQMNHIKIQQSCKIVVLPKSPFGKHQAYNEETNFIENHFSFEKDPYSPKQELLSKKLGLLNKRINKMHNRLSYIKKYDKETYEEFDSQGGKLFCKRPVSLIQIYQDECEQYKAYNLGQKFDDLKRERSIFSKLKYPAKNVFNRLYSPKRKVDDSQYKKFEKVFDSKILKLG